MQRQREFCSRAGVSIVVVNGFDPMCVLHIGSIGISDLSARDQVWCALSVFGVEFSSNSTAADPYK